MDSDCQRFLLDTGMEEGIYVSGKLQSRSLIPLKNLHFIASDYRGLKKLISEIERSHEASAVLSHSPATSEAHQPLSGDFEQHRQDEPHPSATPPRTSLPLDGSSSESVMIRSRSPKQHDNQDENSPPSVDTAITIPLPQESNLLSNGQDVTAITEVTEPHDHPPTSTPRPLFTHASLKKITGESFRKRSTTFIHRCMYKTFSSPLHI
jgi:hypothetical protein